MVRKYIKKSNRNSWSLFQLESALDDVLLHGKNINATAREWNIPRSTLQKKVREEQSSKNGNLK